MAMTLSKTVGKNAHGQTAPDVKLVQIALNAIKDKKSSPLYKGRIDGKCGPKTICAIEQFQCTVKIPVTGKIAPQDRTMNKLREKTPRTTINKLAKSNPSSFRSISTMNQIKIKTETEAKLIKSSAPLPAAEAKALHEIIVAAGKKGVLISVKDIKVTPAGKAEVDFEVLGLTSASGQQSMEIVAELVKIVNSNRKWSFDKSNFLLTTSQWSTPYLKSSGSLSSNMIKSLGIQGYTFKYSLSKSLLIGLEDKFKKQLMSETLDSSAEKAVIVLVSKESSTLTTKLGGNNSSNLDTALKSVQSTAASLGRELISNTSVREWYINTTVSESKKIMELAKSGKVGWFEASYKAYNIRDKVMNTARGEGTTFGKTLAEFLKKQSPQYMELAQKKINKLFPGKTYETLSQSERKILFKEIIESSGRQRASVNKQVAPGKTLGRSLWILTFTMAAYSVIEAENKLEETGRQASIIGGGLTGGAAGAKASLICGPFAVYCGIPFILIGSILGAFGAEALYNKAVE